MVKCMYCIGCRVLGFFFGNVCIFVTAHRRRRRRCMQQQASARCWSGCATAGNRPSATTAPLTSPSRWSTWPSRCLRSGPPSSASPRPGSQVHSCFLVHDSASSEKCDGEDVAVKFNTNDLVNLTLQVRTEVFFCIVAKLVN